MVRTNQHNFSNILYKDQTKRSSIDCLDTPAYRTAMKNTKNFSQNKYKQNLGNYSQVADMRMQHATNASKLNSENCYRKGLTASRPPSGLARDFVNNGVAGGFLKPTDADQRAQTASGWVQERIGRPLSAQGLRDAENEARAR